MPDASQPAGVPVNVLLDDDVEIEPVADALRQAGMHVTATHAALGVVSGTVPEVSLDQLATVAGVASVERDREVGPLG